MGSSEAIFWDNVAYNKALAKRKAKPKFRSILKVVIPISPDEVISKLKELGINIHRNTLLRYEKAELIPLPERGSHGKGKGRYSDYPPQTVAEAAASYCLLHGYRPDAVDTKWPKIPPELVEKIRKRALDFERGNLAAIPDAVSIETIYTIEWLKIKNKVEANIPLEHPIEVTYSLRDGRLIKEIRPSEIGIFGKPGSIMVNF